MSNKTPAALTNVWIFDITSYIMYTTHNMGVWGGVVVKALRYSSDGLGINSRWCHWIFQ